MKIKIAIYLCLAVATALIVCACGHESNAPVGEVKAEIDMPVEEAAPEPDEAIYGVLYSRDGQNYQGFFGETVQIERLDEQTVSVSFRENTYQVPIGSGIDAARCAAFFSEQRIVVAYPDENRAVSAVQSDDGGQHWESFTIRTDIAANEICMGYTSLQNGWLIVGGDVASGHQTHSIYKTKDGGSTWSKLDSNADAVCARVLKSAFFVTEETGLMCLRYEDDESAPNVFITQDGGATWAQLALDLPDPCAEYTTLVKILGFDGETMVLPIFLVHQPTEEVKGYVLYESTDFGRSWEMNAEESVLPENQIRSVEDAARFDTDTAITVQENKLDLTMLVPGEFSDDFVVNPDEATLFQFLDGETRRISEYSGRVWSIIQWTNEQFKERYEMNIEPFPSGRIDPNAFLLGKDEENVYLLILASDVQYDPTDEISEKSYYLHYLYGYTMLSDFFDRNEIVENPNWKQEYLAQLQRLGENTGDSFTTDYGLE